MSRCRIFVNNLFVGNRINDALGLLEDSLSGSLVTDDNCLTNFLDRSAEFRAQTHVLGAAVNRLTSALSGLCSIGHVFLRGNSVKGVGL